MKEGKVSIIVPCYRASETITGTLNSIINQTYTNWEAIVIDDCSDDNTVDVVNSIISREPRIKLIQLKENSGSASRPRNEGIKQSDGEFIAFLDADDTWMSDKLEKQIYFLQQNNYSFVFSNYYKTSISNNDGFINRLITAPKAIKYKDLLKSNVIGCLTVLYSVKKIGKQYFKEVGHEDYLLWLTILKNGVTAYNIDEPLAVYRTGAKSLSSNKLKTIRWTWNILRKEQGLSLLSSIYYFTTYAVLGYLKYKK